MPNLLPETIPISLNAGTKLAVFGANESGIAKFRRPGEDRYEFFNAGQARQMKELPAKNFELALVNGKLPTDIMQAIETACDRSGVQTILITEGGGPLVEAMEQWPQNGHKGVVNLNVPKVIRKIEAQGGQRRPPAPPKPPDTPPPPPPPPPQGKSMEEVLSALETYYDQFGGDHKQVISHVRSLGVGEDKISYGALYQRILTIRKRREKQGSSQGSPNAATQLLSSDLGQRLSAVAQSAADTNGRLVELAGQLVNENAQLQETVRTQARTLQELEGLREENSRLRRQLQPFLDAAAAVTANK